MNKSATDMSLNIVGMVVNFDIQQQLEVEQSLIKIPGVELYAESNGKLIITVDDNESELPLVETIAQLNNIPGVLATSIAYHHFEDYSANQEKQL